MCFSGERNPENVSQFYQEEEDSLDGVVVGSSAAYRYWRPPEAFNRHGWRCIATGFRACRFFL